MMLDTSKNILIVGLVLIGGSYAKALRKLGFKISAITANVLAISLMLLMVGDLIYNVIRTISIK